METLRYNTLTTWIPMETDTNDKKVIKCITEWGKSVIDAAVKYLIKTCDDYQGHKNLLPLSILQFNDNIQVKYSFNENNDINFAIYSMIDIGIIIAEYTVTRDEWEKLCILPADIKLKYFLKTDRMTLTLNTKLRFDGFDLNRENGGNKIE